MKIAFHHIFPLKIYFSIENINDFTQNVHHQFQSLKAIFDVKCLMGLRRLKSSGVTPHVMAKRLKFCFSELKINFVQFLLIKLSYDENNQQSA